MPARAKDFLSAAVDTSEAVAEELASAFRVDVDSADVSEVAGMLAKEMRRNAFRAANGAKFERELDEKYGVLKDVILHPTVQVHAARVLYDNRLPVRAVCRAQHGCTRAVERAGKVCRVAGYVQVCYY